MDNSRTAVMLPDSRLSTDKGRVSGFHPFFGRIDWVPVFCANCAKPWGNVPYENTRFACFLCNDCASHWGEQFGQALIPDKVFWETVKNEMIEQYGRVLTESETLALTDVNALSTLLKGV